MDDELRFLDLLRSLSTNGIDFVVVGGVAGILAGAPISTFELDIVYSRTPANIDRLIPVLQTLDALYRDPAGRRIRPDASKLATIRTHLLKTRFGSLDLLASVGTSLAYEDLLDRCDGYEVEGLELKVLDLETLIESKEVAGRPKDLATLPILRQTLEIRSSQEATPPDSDSRGRSD